MEAKETNFSFIRNTSRYEIPFFQRGYVWQEENWDELLENVLDGSRNHFMGSIILKNLPTSSGSMTRWSIIDGQQRLTTLSILFRAAYDALPINEYDEETREGIKANLNFFLFNRENRIGAVKEIKIKHSRIDREEYKMVIEGEAKSHIDSIILSSECEKDQKPSHNILQCYKYFYKKLENDPEKSARVYEFLIGEEYKILVKIDLASDENEQAIFDTVNTAGVRLTCADTIKNALFQRIKELSTGPNIEDGIVRFYQDTWESTFLSDEATIEYWNTEKKMGRLKRDNLEILLHSVALIKLIYDPYKNTLAELTDLFRKYIASIDEEKQVEDLVKEIVAYAKIYRKHIVQNDSTTRYSCDNPVLRVLHILDVMDISTLHPYLLKLLHDNDMVESEEISENLSKKLKHLETYIIRLVACNDSIRIRNLGKVCSKLLSERTIEEEIIEKNSYINDSVIETQLLNQPSNKAATLILFWIEMYRRHNDNRVSVKELAYSYTLEHILPQKWKEFWPIPLTPISEDCPIEEAKKKDEDNIIARQAAVYEIGNMTLLNGRLNSSISNYDIVRKIEGEKSKKGIRYYNELSITKAFLETYDRDKKWDEATIRARSLRIINEFKKYWPIDIDQAN